MKIFNKNLNKNIKKVGLNTKTSFINKIKYLPAFSKEWKNIIYSFNKNNLKNLPSNNININKIIKGYFDLFFKKRLVRTKFISLKKRRRFLRRIYTSQADIKFTSSTAKITLFIINKGKKALQKKYYNLYKMYTLRLFNKYIVLYNLYLRNIYTFINKKYNAHNKYFFVNKFINKKKYINYKLNYLNVFFKINKLFLVKIWIKLISTQSRKFSRVLRKYSLLYSINQFKFNKSRLLSKLTYFLEKLIGKKLEYNIIHLKSITFHPEIFTDWLALKIKKNLVNPRRWMNTIINKANLLKENNIVERTRVQKWDKMDVFKNEYKDLKIVSHLNETNDLSTLLQNVHTKKSNSSASSTIHNKIFNSIQYKKLNGIRLEVSGRLTKRYRADRALSSLKWKGGLKNIDSSFKGLSTVQYKGNQNANISYSFSKSKRRIGSFAVKGWISSK